MRKLYFRKLFKGIKYAVVFFLIYILGANVLVTIANFFKDAPLLQLLVLMGIPALIVFVWASFKRAKERELGKVYKKDLGMDAGNIKAELAYVLKSNDYRAELLSGITYAILLGAWLTLPGSVPALPIRLLNCLIYVVMIFAVYAIGDLASWLWVHGKFRKDELL